MKAILIGAFEKKDNDSKTLVLTEFAQKINEQTGGKLLEQLDLVGPLKHCKTRFFYNLHQHYPVIAVVGLGSIDAGFNELEDLNEAKENVRSGIGSGINALRDLDAKIDLVEIDGCNDPTSAAEGATLASYSFDHYKQDSLKVKQLSFKLAQSDSNLLNQYERGIIFAESQNKCRDLMEQPANLMTPTRFSEIAKELCEPLGVQVIVHDKKWAEEKKMGSFLSVAKGSDEPPKFVELHFKNAGDESKPIVFVGKGITFDSGGISLKPGLRMDLMRGDMGGAANVVSTIAALAKLKTKINIIGLIPLTENLPSGKANKPGDVVFAMNGKSIQIDNTDAEGRLILCDALCYAQTFDPKLVVDIATLTGACKMALGGACSGVYSTSEEYWQILRKVGHQTGDRPWRLPLYSDYKKKCTDSTLADLTNLSKNISWGAGSPIAAAFLREFVDPKIPWMHFDIYTVLENADDYPYMTKGMSGRPCRTMINFFENVALKMFL